MDNTARVNINMKKDTICAVPWMHLNFEPNGKVVPCCLTSTHNYFAGDLKTESIIQIWNSDNMKKLRKQMINGEEPKICDTCFNKERVTGSSGRIYHNADFPEVLNKIPDITLEDGTCTTMELKYWDFRFSNLCNFKCRSCGPRYSSAWVPDAKKLGYVDQEKVWNIEAVNNGTNYDFLKDQVLHVKRIYFAGGEPLMMPEHWQTLDLLVKNKRFDVRLAYNTNCSSLTYGKKNAIEYWKQWQDGKIEIWPSLDEIGPRAELIRSGTIWHRIEENLKELVKLTNITIRPGITVGAWNIARIPEIITYLVDIGVISGKHFHRNFFFNLLENPTHYHMHVLPDEYKDAVHERITKFIADFNIKYSTKIDDAFTHILHELKRPFNYDAAVKFVIESNKVDAIRLENIFDVIPEMNAIKKAIDQHG